VVTSATLFSGKESSVPVGFEVWWVSGSVWKLWRRKCVVPVGYRIGTSRYID
jgi:hypothetical protein